MSVSVCSDGTVCASHRLRAPGCQLPLTLRHQPGHTTILRATPRPSYALRALPGPTTTFRDTPRSSASLSAMP
ncbi:hypothetical protein E2C01_000739 [Portunus trituberculatus]|uniref:Uncharacterized protein n=1 Tax=Portunus trituberculatus TaxID=210409 RepID=A0A5B7CEX3_PORTR|nr:hypothetical protein [Portunus trituberculatus]